MSTANSNILAPAGAVMWWDGGERAITAREKYRIEEHSPSCFTIPLAPPVDVDKLLADCVPGGSITDPQVVADNIRAWFAQPAEPAEQRGVGALSTSDSARCYIAHFFAREMRRHDFATYIATDLAADFACALAQHLAARQSAVQRPERRAPVQGYHGKSIPWRVHGMAWEAYARKYPGQDAEKIAARGGFATQEMDAFLPGWRDMAEGTPARGIDLVPRPMNTAPRDGTMIRLLVQFTEHATEDKAGPAWTIGTRNDHNVGELEWGGWQFAGWCWTHDHFTEGKGTPVGWLPLIDGQSDAAPGVAP